MKMQQMPLAFVVLAGAAAAPAVAQFIGSGGREGVSSAVEARLARESTPVQLSGAIVERQSDGIYIFRDRSGDIPVKIDTALWSGREATPQIAVSLTGRAEGRGDRRRIEVRTLDAR